MEIHVEGPSREASPDALRAIAAIPVGIQSGYWEPVAGLRLRATALNESGFILNPDALDYIGTLDGQPCVVKVDGMSVAIKIATTPHRLLLGIYYYDMRWQRLVRKANGIVSYIPTDEMLVRMIGVYRQSRS